MEASVIILCCFYYGCFFLFAYRCLICCRWLCVGMSVICMCWWLVAGQNIFRTNYCVYLRARKMFHPGSYGK